MIKKIKCLIFETVNIDKSTTINEDTVILRDLNLDSLELVSLVCAVEDEFDVEIPDKDIKKIITVGDLISFIKSQQ